MRKNIEILAFLALDVAAFHAALIAAFYLRAFFPGFAIEQNIVAYRELTRLLVAAPILTFYFSGLYRIRWMQASIEDFIAVVNVTFVMNVLVLVIAFIHRTDPAVTKFPFSVIVINVFTAPGAMIVWRLAVRAIYEQEVSAGRARRRLAFVGLSHINDYVLERVAENANPGYDVIGYVGTGNETAINGLPCIGEITAFEETVEKVGIDEVILSLPPSSYHQLVGLVQACEKKGVEYRILPSLMDMLTSRSRIDLVNYVPMLRFGESRIAGWNFFFKWLLDKIVATALLIIGVPFLPLIALLIKLDSRGPVFFTQPRVGLNGVRFGIVKFRTMVRDAHERGALTVDDDPRITRVGRLLRKFSIDELPQLVNVLKGDMSLVGPRAVVPYVAERFDEIEKMTLAVPPGITGLAQVSGRNEIGFYDKSLLNLYYIRNYSIFLDIKILFRTIGTVLSMHGTGGTRTDR